MRALLRIVLLITCSVAPTQAQTIEGPVTARSGEQHFYRLSAPLPVGEFRWHLEWLDASGQMQRWEGNENRSVLNLTFAAQSGPHALWVITNSGTTPPLAIDVAPGSLPAAVAPVATTFRAESLNLAPVASADLTTPSPSRPAVPTLPEAAAAASAPIAASSPATTIITADDHNVLDLAASGHHDDASTATNPFRVRYQPQTQTRETVLNVSLVHVGQDPRQSSVVINGELYGIGDAIEGLTLAAISPDWIEFRGPQLIARVPAQDQPVVLRLAR